LKHRIAALIPVIPWPIIVLGQRTILYDEHDQQTIRDFPTAPGSTGTACLMKGRPPTFMDDLRFTTQSFLYKYKTSKPTPCSQYKIRSSNHG
jgi:hypothetical protein